MPDHSTGIAGRTAPALSLGAGKMPGTAVSGFGGRGSAAGSGTRGQYQAFGAKGGPSASRQTSEAVEFPSIVTTQTGTANGRWGEFPATQTARAPGGRAPRPPHPPGMLALMQGNSAKPARSGCRQAE